MIQALTWIRHAGFAGNQLMNAGASRARSAEHWAARCTGLRYAGRKKETKCGCRQGIRGCIGDEEYV